MRFALMCLLLAGADAAEAAASQCYGAVHRGRVVDAVRLPSDGPNFSAYSTMAVAAGRTYVHSEVAAVIAASYAALAQQLPDTVFVYGETGHANGGRFKPHRTHQNGLSVDFFMPVRDAAGKSVALPISLSNKLGYAIEFDAQGRFESYRIDFPALAEHLYQLDVAARARRLSLAKVIIDPRYYAKLFATPRGAYLKARLPWMKTTPWVRHDEHFHVDVAVPCRRENPA